MITTRELKANELANVSGGVDRSMERTPRSRYTFNTVSRIENSSGMRYNVMVFIQQAKRCGASVYDVKSKAKLSRSFDMINPSALCDFIDKWYESIPNYGTLPT